MLLWTLALSTADLQQQAETCIAHERQLLASSDAGAAPRQLSPPLGTSAFSSNMKLRWLHIPKTGTSFINTACLFACHGPAPEGDAGRRGPR